MLSKPGIEWIERALAHLPSWRSGRNKGLGALTIALTFVLLSNASQEAHAAPASAHTCAANVGFGGLASGTLALTKAGDGCAVIKYTSGGTTYFETFNYTGANQSWTVPTGVSTATFYLIGAGGGGGWSGGNSVGLSGGGGGFVSGSYSVTAGSTLTIIVGEGGGGKSAVLTAGAYSTPETFGGGGKGGSVQNGIYSPIGYSYASGGGRSAIRLSGASTDLATAAGGGGGGYSGCGAGGGGDVGLSGASSATGGTQSAGGTGGTSANSHPGTAGSAYQGGNSIDEGGGGGGGYFGGGGGGDNGGGGGGSSYKALLTGGITTTGTTCGTAGASTGLGYTVSYDANGATSGTAPADTTILVSGGGTLASNTGILARTGFVFDGWNTSADGSGTSYAIASTSFKPLADTTLYAQWNSTITYSVNSANGGTAPASQTAIGQKPLTLQTNSGGLLRTGYTFAGWNTAADGSGTRYAAGATSYVSSGNATLYAYWLPAPGIPVFQQSSDSGSSNTDYITNDSTPEVSASGLVVGASVTITAYNSANTAIGSCTFTATSTTQSCSISTALPSENYYFRATQSLYGFTTPISANSTPVVKINTVLPTAYVITVGSNTTISWKNTQTGQVSVNATGTAYLVRSTVNVTDINSITSADGSLWNSVSITSANVATNIALTGLLGGTYKAYVVDVAGNLSLASASSMLIYSQANAATDLVATPGVGSMGPKFDLTWTAPTDNGGGIDSYLIQYSNDGGTTWVSYQRNANPGTTYSVYPVNYETDYIFRITAVNLWGNGTTSTSSEVKRVAIPSCSPATSPNGFTLVFPVGVCAWTVPTGVTSIKVDARGAQGGWGDYAPGSGGQVIGTLTVTPGETLYMYVGDQGSDKGTSTNPLLGRGGFNGGGFGGQGGAISGGMNGAGGGGATDIRTTINSASSRVVVSGGGGGTTYQGNSCCRNIGGGGNGGGTTGAQTTTSDGSGGGGGTQSAGGYSYGTSAGAGFGGAGEDPTSPSALGGGGGGSGYYGGGGGGGPWRTGGGGGSSYVSNSRFTSTTNSQGVNCAPGFLAITIGNDTSQVPPLPNTCGATADTTSPVVSTVSPPTVNAAGSIITIIYTDVNFLNTNYVPSSLFTVTSGGSSVAISSITFMNKVLYLNLAQNLKPDATTTISYTDATSGNDIYVVQDAFGNDAPSFTNISIATNAITVATPTTPVLAAASDTGSSNTDKNTNDNTPTFSSSSLVVGATVTFTATPSAGSAVTCVITATATTDSCTFTTLSNSTYSIAVKQTSGTVTSGSPTPLTGVVIDTTRPTVALTSTITNGGNFTATVSAPSATYTITATFSEAVSGLLISEITKDAQSTGWSISTSLTASSTSVYTFTASNSQGTGNTAGQLLLRIAEGVAADTAGNTNTATTNDFVINTLIQVTLSNTYGTASPVVGGNVAYAAQTSSGAAITLPGAGTLTRNYHSFAGWSLTTNGNGAVIGSTYTPTVPTTLYSSWTPNTFVVSFGANGGTGAPDSATVNYTYGTTGLAISSTYNRGTLTKTGYTFAGWSASNGGAAVTNPYSPTSSLTLYARWTANTYAITFDSNTATSGTMNNLGITAGDRIALWGNLFVKTGFTFTGWNSAANGKGTPYGEAAFVTLYGNTTLYAQWQVRTPGTPTITSVSAGNTSVVVTVAGAGISGSAGAVDSFTVQAYNDAGTLLTGKTCTVLATASPLLCTISGLTNGTVYKFKTTAFNSTGSRDNGSGFSSTATPAPYTVIYNINGGTSGAISNGSYDLGTPLTLPTPSRTSYTLVGWYDTTTAGTLIGVGGASYSPSTSVTIYARWVGVGYTITYYGNGATAGSVPTAGSFTAGGSAYTVASNSGTLERTGYTFGGWNTSTAGNGTSYAVGASYNANANLNLYAKWTPIARTVTYAGTTSSGSLPAQLTNKYIGETFTVSSSTGFARSGYIFSGWSDGTNLYAAGSTYTVGSTNVTLTAQWSGISYSVTYLANGGSGSLPTQSNLSAGETFTVQSSSLARTGYSFVAWNDGTANYTPGSTYTMSGANASLIAQWTATGYTITFNGNGADGGSAPATGHYVTGGAPYAVALNSYTKTGYTFTGWKSAGNVDYAPGSGYAGTADLVLYALWTPKVISISYNVNGGTGTTPTTTTWTYDSATATNLDPGTGLAKTGYTLGGWASSASATAGSFTGTPSSSLTYYAVWTPVTYAITYTAGTNGTGSVPTQTGKALGSTFALASSSGLSRPDESDVSFSFAYWSDSGTTYAPGATFLMPARDVTLVANWIAIYNVTYNANGGVTNNASVQKTESATVTIGDAPTREGYTFGKWVAQSGEQFDAGASTTVQNNRYLFTASWTAIPRSVTYGLNGGTGSAPATLTGKTIGQLITLDSTTATKDGYTFGGWNIGGTTYPVGASFTISTVDVAPAAVWNAATYSVTYNGNGATGGTTPNGGTFTTGGSYSAASNTGSLVKAGFTFVGWNTSANGTGTDFAESATNVTTAADLILYAKWSAASYAVTYALNGASSSQPTQANVQFGSTFTVAAAATQTGKTFTGWSDGNNSYGGGSTYTMGTVAVTLTATWANQLYAVTYSLNGGSGDIAPIQKPLSSSDSFTVQTTSATKSGYSFGGWSNGTSTYQANTTYNMSSANVTLLALWNVAAPGTPGTPTVTPGDGNATITIAAPSSGGTPTSYTVTASPSGLTCTVYGPATSCVISGLSNGTSYTFTSTATNSSGTAGPSPASSAVTPATKPTVVSSVAAVAGNGNAAVNFVAPASDGGSAITSYVVTSSPGGFTCTVNAPFTPPIGCTVNGLTNGTAYSFTVRANNGGFTSDTSSASVPVVPMTVPGAPSLSAASSSTTSPGSATITITPPASNGGDTITAYIVTSSPDGLTCITYAPATTCEISGLAPGVAYTFTAVAQNSVPGGSANSAPSNAVTPVSNPSPPTNVVAAAGDDQATVSFTAPANNGSAILSYKVIALTVDGVPLSPEVSCTPAPGATSCVLTPLINGTAYRFSVTATNAVGTSIPSATSAVATPEDQFAPRLLTSGVPAGVDIVGNVLTASMIFEGAPTPTVTYQWQRCPDLGNLTTCVDISGATAGTYTTTSTDATTYIRVRGTAVNGVSPSAVWPSALTAEITGVPRATTPTTGLTADINQPYSLATVAFGGAAPIIYAITLGTLPAGLNFDSTNGNITGTPTTVGSASLTISATDQKGQSSSITFMLSVVDPNAVAPSAPASPAYVPPAPSPTPADTSAADAAAKAAAEKALADKAAADAAAKAAADAAAKALADKAAATAAAKAIADQAAATAAAKSAADKLAASQAAQAAADKAAADAAARKAAAAKAVAAAADAAAKAAALAKTPAVTTAAKNAAAAAAQIAQTQATAAVKSAAQAAATEVATKSAAAVKANDVTISIGSLTSALNSAASSAKSDAAAKAVQAAADAAAKSADADAVTAKNSATAAAKAAATAVAAAAAQQKASADALAAAQQKADALAAVVAENAAAEVAAQKAASALAEVLAQRAEISSKLATSLKPADRASAEKALAAVEDKLDAAQEIADKAVEQVEVLGASQEKLQQSVIVAAAAAETQSKLADLATKVADTKSAAAEKASAKAVVATVAATAAKATAKTIAAVKAKAPIVAAKGVRSDALINITGLKPGQKIRVSVKVNIK